MPTGRAEPAPNFVPNRGIDPHTMNLEGTVGTLVSYYRPSGSKGFHFYNGKVHSSWSVMFPTGCRREVVAGRTATAHGNGARKPSSNLTMFRVFFGIATK